MDGKDQQRLRNYYNRQDESMGTVVTGQQETKRRTYYSGSIQ